MWHVVEEDSFERSAAQLGGLRYVDAALAPIMNVVESNPLAFEEVPDMPGIRVAHENFSDRSRDDSCSTALAAHQRGKPYRVSSLCGIGSARGYGDW